MAIFVYHASIKLMLFSLEIKLYIIDAFKLENALKDDKWLLAIRAIESNLEEKATIWSLKKQKRFYSVKKNSVCEKECVWERERVKEYTHFIISYKFCKAKGYMCKFPPF